MEAKHWGMEAKAIARCNIAANEKLLANNRSVRMMDSTNFQLLKRWTWSNCGEQGAEHLKLLPAVAGNCTRLSTSD